MRLLGRQFVTGRTIDEALENARERELRGYTFSFDMTRDGFEAVAVADLERAVSEADIVSCATLSTTPIVRGDWLPPGVHLDLVGAFKAGV